MNRKFVLALFFCIFSLIITLPAFSIPQTLNFQGRLTYPSGTAEVGIRTIDFKLFPVESGGGPVGTPSIVTKLVTCDVNGVFSAMLDFNSSYFDGSDRWLEVQVQGDASPLSPRQKISVTPYAYRAITAESVVGGGGGNYISKTGDTMTGKFTIITTPEIVCLKVIGSAEIGHAANSAKGQYSIATGNGTTANGNYSTAMGYLSSAEGIASVALGYNAKAKANFSIAMGWGSMSDGPNCVTMGNLTYASNNSSLAMGQYTTATGLQSCALGFYSVAGGESSVAMGNSTTAMGTYAFAMGNQASAEAIGATAIGYQTTAKGLYSMAFGEMTTAKGDYSTALGRRIVVNGTNSVGIGLDATSRTLSPNNTLAIMGGRVGIGTTEPAASLEVYGTILGAIPITSVSFSWHIQNNTGYTAMITAGIPSTGKIYVKSTPIATGVDLTSTATWNSGWLDLGAPEPSARLVCVSGDFDGLGNSNQYGALVIARTSSGKVWLKRFWTSSGDQLTATSCWSGWVDFGNPGL